MQGGMEDTLSGFEDEPLQEGGGVTHAATGQYCRATLPSVQVWSQMADASEPPEPNTRIPNQDHNYSTAYSSPYNIGLG